MYEPSRYINSPWGGLSKVMPDGSIREIRRDFGLTWQGRGADGSCSREMHQQIYTYMTGEPCPPGYYLNDPPSVNRPPGEQQLPPPVPPPQPPP